MLGMQNKYMCHQGGVNEVNNKAYDSCLYILLYILPNCVSCI